MKTPDMDELDALINGQVEKFLAGYIERHREAILAAVAAEYPNLSDGMLSQRRAGAVQAMRILSAGLPAESTPTPPDASSGQERVP